MIAKWCVALALTAGVGGTGCAAMSSGAATEAGVKYVFGDLKGTLPADVGHTFDVANEVIEDMGLRIERSEVTEIDGDLVAYTARDRKIHLRVDSIDDAQSQLSIRIGSLGDENLSLRIYQRIEEAL